MAKLKRARHGASSSGGGNTTMLLWKGFLVTGLVTFLGVLLYTSQMQETSILAGQNVERMMLLGGGGGSGRNRNSRANEPLELTSPLAAVADDVKKDAPSSLQALPPEGTRRYVVFCGTRPEIVKTAPLVLALKTAQMPTHVVFTGQHPDIAQPFREFFDIQFDTIVSEIFESGQSLGSLTGRLVTGIERYVPRHKGDVWIVQGDTSTAFAAGTVAFLRQIPVIHLEAGLRTFDHHAPYPEEFHRRALSLVTSLHISPTTLATQRLLAQGVDPRRIFTLGNTGMDAARIAQPNIHPNTELQQIQQQHTSQQRRLVLVTLHRRENAAVMDQYYDIMGTSDCVDNVFVVPVHPNPTATRAATAACRKYATRFQCVKPLGYAETQWMLQQADFIITDSGGLQEEATWYSRPVFVVRQDTERPEAITAGLSVLAPDPAALRAQLAQVCQPNSPKLASMRVQSYPFGHGNTSQAVVELLHDSKVDSLLELPIQFVDKTPQTQRRDFPPCETSPWWQQCRNATNTVDVVLTVWKRPFLKRQLQAVARQQRPVQRVWVVQNEHHIDAAQLVREFQAEHTNFSIPIEVITFTSNSKFHGRFHIAYFMSDATYVSIWDDDHLPSYNWVGHCVEYSEARGGALVGGNGRNIMWLKKSFVQQRDASQEGQVDFVGHTWTIRRENLRYLLGALPQTFSTGEDIQLAAALQRFGIHTYSPPQFPEEGRELVGMPNLNYTIDDKIASCKQPAENRNWLFCKLVHDGFVPLECHNCTKANTAECVKYFDEGGKVER